MYEELSGLDEKNNTVLKRLKILEEITKTLIDDMLFSELRFEKLEYIMGLNKPNKVLWKEKSILDSND